MIVTGIDLGSNSFRVLRYDFFKKEVLDEYESVVGTADGLKQTGLISNEAINRIVKAIKVSLEKIKYDPNVAIAVTTSAMRQASNSTQVIEKIKQETGVKFNIISGEEEAKLTLLAIKYALKRENIKSDGFILVDIGGGSTELIFATKEKEITKSFEYGIVTLTQSQNKKEMLKNFKEKIIHFINKNKIPLNLPLIATAGTPTTIAALKHNLNYKTYDSKIVNGTKLNLNDLDYYKNYLNTLSLKEVDILVGAGRSEYMEAGIDIFKTFYNVLKKYEATVFDDGLREGVCINEAIKNGWLN